MSLIKNEIPILEYDDNETAIIMPNRNNLYKFPKKAVFPFLADEVEKFAISNNCEKIGEYVTATKVFPIYKLLYNAEEICVCQAPVGAAASTMMLDFLIGYGVTQIIASGTCGALLDLNENEFLIPTEALRSEGTSYHYLPPSRTITLNTDAIKVIEDTLQDHKIAYTHCKTWTTDGFFRETKDMVEYRKSEGFSVVEMECSALVACAQFRKVTFGQLLFTADSLANVEAHDERDWGLQSFPLALKLSVEAVCKL